MNKEKFNIVYKYFAKPIAAMKMTYNNSAMTVEAGVVIGEEVIRKTYERYKDILKV